MIVHDYFTLPIELAWLIIEQRLYRKGQIYLYLKANCNGKIKMDKILLDNLSQILGLKTKRHIKNEVNELINKNWLGYNPKSGYLFVRSFSHIGRVEGFTRKTVVIFQKSEITNLKAFCIAAIIEDLIRKQKRKQKRAERIKGRSIQPNEASASFYPIANIALAKILGISIQSAFAFKKLAQQAGFLEIKNNKTYLQLSHQHVSLYKKYVANQNPNKIRLTRLTNNNCFIYKQEIDTIKTFLIFKYGKKIKSSIKGY